MTDESQQVEQQEDQGGILSALNLAIDGLNLAKEVSGPTPAKAVFGSVAILLLMIRVGFLLFCDAIFQAHRCPGHDGQRTGLR